MLPSLRITRHPAGTFVLLGMLLLNPAAEALSARAIATTVPRWIALDPAVVMDRSTGLQWTARDNGADIAWAAASLYCRSRGRGWRLPTLVELKSIFDPGEPGTRCGPYTCRIARLFRLGGSWFWSATPVGTDAKDGDELTWGVGFVNGVPTPTVTVADYGSRALCVCRP